MKSDKLKKVLVSGMVLAFVLSVGSVVEARTVTEAEAQVDTEYAAGNMDTATHNDLQAILGTAMDTASMVEAQEAFNVLIAVLTGGVIETEAANRLMGTFDGL